MPKHAKIPNFWSSEYRFNGVNCLCLNRFSFAVGTDNIVGGHGLRFTAYNPVDHSLLLAGEGIRKVGKVLMLHTQPGAMPRQLVLRGIDAEKSLLFLQDDPHFSTAEIAVLEEWRGAVPDGVGTESAFVCGDDNFASGAYSFASGKCSTATGKVAHAEGIACRALGDYSFAFGANADAAADHAIAIGREVTTRAPRSVLIGDHGVLENLPELEGAFGIASGGEIVLLLTRHQGVELKVQGTVRAQKITDLDGNPLTPGSGGAAVPLSIPIPADADGDLLQLRLELADDPAFSEVTVIDTSLDTAACYVFASDHYVPFPASGVGGGYYGSRVLVDISPLLQTRKFIRYRWSDGHDITEWRAL